uniref:Sulfotransferase n=1 Tax=Sphaeramia orbicularis TaxID=375764 RepID=A0A673A1K0_9TELE
SEIGHFSLSDYPARPELFKFRGVWMTHLFTDNWEKIVDFQARPDDIFIMSYPRSGNTWVSHTTDMLCFGQKFPERDTSVYFHNRVPILEVACDNALTIGTDMIEKLTTSPRIIKCHLPVQLLPKSVWEQNCRIVYVARNAKDNVVSLFHYERMTKILPEPGDWSSYLQRFMQGKMVFGSWYDHVNGWWEKKNTYSNIHYMFYEDLIEDTDREIDALCCFLGLSPSAEEKELVRRKVRFDEMKENDKVNHSTFKLMDFNISTFIRKGKVADWKNHFTVAQSEEFDEDYKKKMKGSTLKFKHE